MSYFGSLLFLVMFLLLAVITGFLHRSAKNSRNQAVKSLFLIFFFISCYSLILGIFSMFGQNYPYLAVFGYNLAVLLAFVSLYFITRIPTFSESNLAKKYAKYLKGTILTIGAFAMIIQLLDLRLPILGTKGIILWNQNPLATWLTGVTILGYMLIWSYLAYKNTSFISDKYQKLKLQALCFDALCIGISAFLFFPSQNELQSLISFIIIVPAYVFTIYSIIMGRKINKV